LNFQTEQVMHTDAATARGRGAAQGGRKWGGRPMEGANGDLEEAKGSFHGQKVASTISRNALEIARKKENGKRHCRVKGPVEGPGKNKKKGRGSVKKRPRIHGGGGDPRPQGKNRERTKKAGKEGGKKKKGTLKSELT